jgi:hypothetical protein
MTDSASHPNVFVVFIVGLAGTPSVTDDRVIVANRTSPRQEVQWDSPRVDVVFRVRQCDKENHGWREGPPLVLPARIAPATGLHPPGVFIVERKKKTAFCGLTGTISADWPV